MRPVLKYSSISFLQRIKVALKVFISGIFDRAMSSVILVRIRDAWLNPLIR